MKFYIGGKYEEREDIRIIAMVLQEMGFEWTCDWTHHTDVSLGNIYSVEDVNGVLQADFAVFKKDKDYKYKGTWVEMGVALGKGIPVYVVGHAGDSCIFIQHPLVKQFDSFDEFYNFIRR